MRLLLVVAALAVIVAIAASQAFYTVDQTEQAIITQVGVYQTTVTSPGLHVKTPFVQAVHRLDKRLLRFDSAPSEYLTKDKKALVVDAYARYRISDALLFFQSVRTEESAQARLHAVIASELREEVASHDQLEIIRENREALMQEVTRRSAEKARDFGIEVLDVRIGRADFPPQVASRVYDRMKSERQRIANQFRAEGAEGGTRVRAEADKERTVLLADAERRAAEIRGNGEAEAIRVYGEAIRLDQEFFTFLRTLDAYKRALRENTTLVLSSDADIFRYFTSPDPAPAKR